MFNAVQSIFILNKHGSVEVFPSIYLQNFRRPTYKAAGKNIFRRKSLSDVAYKSLQIFAFSINWFTILTATQTSYFLFTLWASYYRKACFIQNLFSFTADDGPPFFMLTFGNVVNFPASLSFSFDDVTNDATGPTQSFRLFDYKRRIISASLLLEPFLKFFKTSWQRRFLPQE